jgi:aminoglycoside phosphotransferase (APT) family kinase protein
MTEPAVAVPRGPEEITSDWLTEALRYAGFVKNGRVSSVSIAALGPGDGLIGRVFRLAPQYEGDTGGAPPSLIAKLPALPGPTLDLALRFRMYEREASFYRELAAKAGVPVPRLYHSACTEDGHCALLLEDMAPGVTGDLVEGCTLDQAARLVEHVAAMHAKWWNSRDLDKLGWLPLPNEAAALEIAADISGDAWKVFLDRYGEHMPERLVALGERLQNDRTVLDRLSAPPRTLVHADLRINNLVFGDRGQSDLLAVLDWQSTVRARGPMDIARLFVNNLEPETRRRAEAELLPEYHRLLTGHGVEGYTYTECWRDYRLAVINQFGQVVVLSSLLDVDSRQDEEVGPATGTRLLVALLDLELIGLMPKRPLPGRILGRLRRFAGIG